MVGDKAHDSMRLLLALEFCVVGTYAMSWGGGGLSASGFRSLVIRGRRGGGLGGSGFSVLFGNHNGRRNIRWI